MDRFAQSATDDGFVQNPYAFYERLRRSGDIVFWEDYGLPVATTYAAVSSVLKDRRLGRRRPDMIWPVDDPVAGAFYALEAHSMLELEPPEHTRLRRLVTRAFTSRSIDGLGPMISRLADALLAEVPGDAPFDLLDGFARPLPVLVIARLLGVPDSIAPDLLRWSNDMVAMYQARRTPEIEAAAGAAAQDFTDFLRGYIDDRRSRPESDLLTALIAAEEDGATLTTDELIATCVLLLNAGHEATVHTIGNAVKLLLESGTEPDALLPDRVEQTVEEIMRFDPPLHMFTRHVYEEVELFGHRFGPGDEIGCLLASANRDDAVWPDGNQFRPERGVRTHMSLGAGIHFCVGAPLARLELNIALPLLFARLPSLALTEAPRYANVYHFHGLERLRVTA